ncbi:hypothetical protein C7212DRAFT_362136 [Tuber magnatum]|uniref:Uncharacterized protein n=1 Tax=Tuber magnatum TaxID=42249 RepID=A0A317T2A5_9PEZI|nr:hypothetical protein C7212DRAFT_362136 [Tuber magnatum]
MFSPPTSENMAPPTPTPRVPRSNSGDSEQSQESWRRYIHETGSYAGTPMGQFLGEHHRMECYAIPNTPLERTNFPQPHSSLPSDLSVAEADCGSSTIHQSDRISRDEGSTYTASSMPTLDDRSSTPLSSPNPSTSYYPQMYQLQEDSSGNLYTHQSVRTTLRTTTRPDGTHPCLFFFNACSEAFDREEDWILHVKSHFSNREIPPPPSYRCSVCWANYEAPDPLVNWERFLEHTFGHFRDGLRQEITPDPDFIRHCRDASMISDFACTRFEGYQQASSEDDRTPRSRRGARGDTDIARVHFPGFWEPSEAQPQAAATIVVNHSRQGRDGRS